MRKEKREKEKKSKRKNKTKAKGKRGGEERKKKMQEVCSPILEREGLPSL